MTRIILAALMLACVAAGPATVPPTQPFADLQARVFAAQQAIEPAKAAALADLHATDAYKAAKAKADALLIKLEAARKNGTAQEKLDASRDFVAANEVLKKLDAGAVKNAPQVVTANASLATAMDALNAAKVAAENAEIARQNADPEFVRVRDGLKHNKVVVGMTEIQARDIVDKTFSEPYKSGSLIQIWPTTTDYGDGSKVVVWKCYAKSIYDTSPGFGEPRRTVRVEIKNGKITDVMDRN